MQSPPPPLPAKSRRRAVLSFLRFVGLAASLSVLASQLNITQLQSAFARIPLATFAFAGLCWTLGMSVRAAKWLIQVRTLRIAFVPERLIRAHLWGILLGIATPLRLGEAYRLVGFSAPSKAATATAGAAIFYEKIVEAEILFCIVALGVWLFFGQPWLAAGFGLLAILGGILIFGSISPPEMFPRFSLLTHLQNARDALSPRNRAVVAALTTLAHGLNFVGAGVVYRSLGQIGWSALCFGLPTITFAAAAPFTVSGVGVRELTAIQVFGGSQLSSEAITVAASLSFLGANVLPVAILLPALAVRSWRANKN